MNYFNTSQYYSILETGMHWDFDLSFLGGGKRAGQGELLPQDIGSVDIKQKAQ